MKENRDSQQCYICGKCGKDSLIIRTLGDVEAPESRIIEGKEEWVCPNCNKKTKGKSIIIHKQESYYDRNTKESLDSIGLTFLIKEKPNFYLDVVITKSQAASYEKILGKDPFKFLKRKGSEFFLEKIEKEDYTSKMIDLSDEVRDKIRNL